MGYSSRYHVASLAAVFVALAVGILIGSEIGGDALNSTRKNLERSLTQDLNRIQDRNDELEEQIGWARDFAQITIGPLVKDRLAGKRFALIGFGSLPESVSEAVQEALTRSGGELVGIGVVREPPSVSGLRKELEGTRFEDLGEVKGLLGRYGTTVGNQMVTGGPVFEASRPELMATSSGKFGSLDGVILFRGPLPEGEPAGPGRVGSLILSSSMTLGFAQSGAALVGVETLASEPSQIEFFATRRIASVDSVELESGQLALVLALRGAQGKFGVKDDADSFVPAPGSGVD